MSPENLENIGNLKGWGLILVNYKKESLDETKRKILN